MDRPILFSAPMVRAILAGTKTQTRRVMKPQPTRVDGGVPYGDGPAWAHAAPGSALIRPKHGKRGDRLWVRESHWWFKDEPDHSCGYYPPKLTAEDVEYRADGDDGRKVWRPSIHMPRWASRITLEITGVRVERLQDISEADARAEGIVECYGGFGLPDGSHFHAADPRESYWSLWEVINGRGSVEANPWTWVVEFRRVAAELGRRG